MFWVLGLGFRVPFIDIRPQSSSFCFGFHKRFQAGRWRGGLGFRGFRVSDLGGRYIGVYGSLLQGSRRSLNGAAATAMVAIIRITMPLGFVKSLEFRSYSGCRGFDGLRDGG